MFLHEALVSGRGHQTVKIRAYPMLALAGFAFAWRRRSPAN